EEEGQELFGEVRSLEPLDEIGRDLGARESVEQDLLAETFADELPLDACDGMSARDRIGQPQRAQHQQPRRLAALGENGQQIERRVVAPLHVLENQDERGLGGKPVEAGSELMQRVLVPAPPPRSPSPRPATTPTHPPPPP